MPDKRIISLLPAATEIVCALGMEHQLVGRSHECDFPETVKNLPVCSSAKFFPETDSATIDRQVKESLTDSLSFYTIDKEKVKALSPDVVITQAQCKVCAVSIKDVEAALENLLDKDAEVVSLEPNNLNDIFHDIQVVAEALNVAEKGKELIENLAERVDLIRHKLKFVDQKPRVAWIEWLSPLMVAGNWMPEMVEIAGGIPLLAENGKHSPYIKSVQLKAENPDILIIAACGFSIERTLQEMHLLFDLPEWSELPAVKNNQIYIADGNSYFNRSGPRMIDSIEILAEIIHPKHFVFGYQGEGWVKFEMG